MQILLLCSDIKLIFEHIEGCSDMLLLLSSYQSVKNIVCGSVVQIIPQECNKPRLFLLPGSPCSPA